MRSTGERNRRRTVEIKKSIIIDASPDVAFKAITDPNELTNCFPDHAILESRQDGRMKFRFYKEKSQMDHTCTADASPEGTIKEFIPNTELSYTWRHKDVPGFPVTQAGSWMISVPTSQE